MDNTPTIETTELQTNDAAPTSPTAFVQHKYMSILEASAYLHCSKRTVYKLCALKKLVYHEAAGLRWFLKLDLDDYIASGRVDIYGSARRRRKSA